jgi:uncharacterized small protein (DUF1192 family)
MTHDPTQDGTSTSVTGPSVTSIPIPWPPQSGPGSDTEAWVAFAREVVRGSEEVLDEQSALIASLEAEVARLRAELAERKPGMAQPDMLEPDAPKPTDREAIDDKPKGGRRRTSEDTRAAILADLAAGLSQSQAARRHGVSAMTVSRLVRRS